MKIDTILSIMEEIERDNPIDFADLPFNEDEMRRSVAEQLSVHLDEMEKAYPDARERELFWIGMLIHQVLENMALNARLLIKDKDSFHQTNQLISGLRRKD